MNIVMLSSNDPAGTGILFTKAINAYTEHCCRLITTETRYNFDFDKDLHVPDLSPGEIDTIPDLLRQADVIHFHMVNDEELRLGPFRTGDFTHGKAVVHHHHGHPHFRANPELYREKYQRLGRKSIVSTPDLLRLLPEASWVPNLVPLEHPLYRPAAPPEDGTVRIGQAPTRTDLKNTSEFVEVTDRLKQQITSPAIEIDLIELCLHSQCLARKNRCHIIFDHMQGYFGVSSLESLSQGKPVIAGLDGWNFSRIAEFAGHDRLPWLIARNPAELEALLTELIHSRHMREQAGAASREFMETTWNEGRVLSRLLAVYNSL